MLLDAGCVLTFDVSAPTPMVLMLRPRSGRGQWVSGERYTFTPASEAVEYVDGFGNLCQRLTAPEGRFAVRAEFEAHVADAIDTAAGAPPTPVEDLPDGVLRYLLPSRYCPSDRMGELARDVVGDAAAGYDQAEAIRAWIHEHFEYRSGSSNASTDALETVEQRAGVCRDFAHLGLALCRSLTIPARMVVGYLHRLEPMDQHAWFEAFVDGRWYTFDATQEEPRGGRLAVAYGRDAADVAFATQFGPATLEEMEVWVEEAG